MEPHVVFSVCLGILCISAVIKCDGDTKIHPYTKYRSLEITRKQVLKKTIFNTVCRPKTPESSDEIVVTDMTVGSRVGPEDKSFEFTKVKDNHTFRNKSELLESTTVKTLNECVGKCSDNKGCLAYAYEDNGKGCKLAKTCKPSLSPAADSQVFMMSYWY
ncbi:uncharacterized protein LOC124147267 isoform X1 [Haliotis rufescens]|uniref:uncharacterized protein LOC124147267 isoform X1 n=1 Tax=Haliotis rufescens TaxID=6454 RepID=UPI001EB02146|nr:uncharacterized protein LOC124147267 isoform X1 [Haliotis rufescens]